MASIFTKLIDGELPAHFVWKDERAVGFLSINPLREGHTLVVPRVEVDHWLDADDGLRSHCFTVARAIGTALMKVYQPEKIGLMLAGLEVPHMHIHLVPMNSVHDLDFSNSKSDVPAESLAREAQRVRSALVELGHRDASS